MNDRTRDDLKSIIHSFRHGGLQTISADTTGCAPDACIVQVLNTQGVSVNRFSVVFPGEALITPDKNLGEFQSAPRFKIAEQGKEDSNRWGVALEPIAGNAVGRVCVSGVTVASVEIGDNNDEFCEADTDRKILKSAASGTARILYKSDTKTDGKNWCIIRFGEPGGEAPPIYAVDKNADFTANPEAAIPNVLGKPIYFRTVSVDPQDPEKYVIYNSQGSFSRDRLYNTEIRNPARFPAGVPCFVAKVSDMQSNAESSTNTEAKETYTVISADTRLRAKFDYIDRSAGLKKGEVYRGAPPGGRVYQLMVAQEDIPADKLNLFTTYTHPFYPLTMNYGEAAKYHYYDGMPTGTIPSHPSLWGWNPAKKQMDRSWVDYTAEYNYYQGLFGEWRRDTSPVIQATVEADGSNAYDPSVGAAYITVNGHRFDLYSNIFRSRNTSLNLSHNDMVPDYAPGDRVTVRLELFDHYVNTLRLACVLDCPMSAPPGTVVFTSTYSMGGGTWWGNGWEDVSNDEKYFPKSGKYNKDYYTLYLPGKVNPASGSSTELLLWDIARYNHNGYKIISYGGGLPPQLESDGDSKHEMLNIQFLQFPMMVFRKKTNYCVRDKNGKGLS